MVVTRKALYNAYKKGGPGNAGIAEMRKVLYNSDPSERGKFKTESDLTSLVSLFRKYDKFAEPLRDTLVFLILVLILMWVYLVVFRAGPQLVLNADVLFNDNSAYELIIISSIVTFFGCFILQLKIKRKCNLDRPENFPESRSNTYSSWILVLLIIIIELIINKLLESNEIGILSFL